MAAGRSLLSVSLLALLFRGALTLVAVVLEPDLHLERREARGDYEEKLHGRNVLQGLQFAQKFQPSLVAQSRRISLADAKDWLT